MTILPSDIAKILERTQIWKSLVTLPKRMAELEKRVAELEAERAIKISSAIDQCMKCKTTLVFTEETNDPAFGDFGLKVHHFKCSDCGFTTTRNYTPGKGY
ncbi:hypothetical protein [Paenochrobactrum glaciei]|uniref:Uncharacterized protein n=1 Tax=Paenochrobactrum glaciei TaxID=486407 RepID=A0ABN1GS00_9HYPH